LERRIGAGALAAQTSGLRGCRRGARIGIRLPWGTCPAIVKWFNAEKGFGFIAVAGGSDAFMHIRQLEAAGHSSVPEGARSGRIEARSGLRMMPTFPRSPLSFRTASFPQYGWKAGCPSAAFLGDQRLKPAPGIRRPPSSLHPPFVHLVVASIIPYCAGSRTRSCTAVVGD